MDDRIQIVARSRSHAVNVGAVCSAFGGGGHAYAASASVRDKTLSEVRDGILTQLYLQEEGEKTARDYMSQPAIGIEEGHTIAEADELMLHFGLAARASSTARSPRRPSPTALPAPRSRTTCAAT